MAGFEGVKWAANQMRYILGEKEFSLLDPDSRVSAVSRSIHYGLCLTFEGIRFFCKRSESGNLEAVFFKKPILVNRYSIYQQDIEPMGFDVVEMNKFVNGDVIAEIQSILENPDKRHRMVEKNFDLASRYFSFELLEQKLKTVLLNFGQI